MIPKKIHYCWFGGNPLPKKDRKCIESWKKYCPDYEIIEWNESNYDLNKNRYMADAYKERKWGFVPDYARFDIIYNHGG
ncbi:TPA: glycosyl transferase, partial [Enterococcus faecium]|nr:glycosyl transferase [Enterococcus faecium]HCC1889504.1 glycosyl transferase [Enterococcus faecium]